MDTIQLSTEFSWKITIIGNESVGKTSLVNRFVNKKFKDSYSETVGIDMFNHDVKVNDTTISLLIYDLGGQEYWKNLRSSFYQRSRGLILVYDVTNPETFDALHDWYSEALENIGYEVPAIILGNKDDLGRKFTQEREKSSFIVENSIETFYTSAKTGEMVEKAFESICNQILKKFNS